MAQVEDWKSRFYSQKQSVRDELSAPLYLESAGDILIKNLAEKQRNTSTTLKEQLEIVQNFEKGFQLNPEIQKGIASLKKFQEYIQTDKETNTNTHLRLEEIQDVDELMKVTGLSRHELELGLSEKPNSAKAQLYKFAIRSKRRNLKCDLGSQLSDHPTNKLKEIEEECFAFLKKNKVEGNTSENQNLKTTEKRIRKRTHKKRKRKKKESDDGRPGEKQAENCYLAETCFNRKQEEVQTTSPSRLSLWDVKDMKKWSESKKVGCAPRRYYTIKEGRIIELEKEQI